MKCEICNQNEATLKVQILSSHPLEGFETVRELCETCFLELRDFKVSMRILGEKEVEE